MRCYDGCPDSELQAILDSKEKAKKKLAKTIPGGVCTYFPNGEFYMVFAGVKTMSGEHKSLFGAIGEAISNYLSKDGTE